MIEIWKDISGYEGLYEASNTGKIKSLKRNWKKDLLILSNRINHTGYASVILYKNKCKKNIRVHRIIATIFISNPENKTQVNHKNGIKHDNNINNLEWVTPSENVRHAFDTGLNTSKGPKGLSVIQSKNGIILRTFETIREAARILNIWEQNISKCCKGKRNYAGGFSWEYKIQGENND